MQLHVEFLVENNLLNLLNRFQHSVSEQFQTHLDEEYRVRGGCPSDWLWLNPSQSGALTSLFHQEMLHYHLSPSFESQVLNN
jgi:hypothetical protein